jgi:hypothetical protein
MKTPGVLFGRNYIVSVLFIIVAQGETNRKWLFIGQTDHIRQLEETNLRLTSEVHTLRARNTNIEVLKQANIDLERKAREAEGLKEKVITLEAEVDASRKEREQWSVYLP